MNMALREQVMRSVDYKIIYSAKNLICTGSNAFDTGFAPYSAENIDKDFKITIRVKSVSNPANNLVILGCKYEDTLDGQQWPGFYFRFNNATTVHIGGYDYYTPTIDSVVGKNLYIWRQSGEYYAQIDGQSLVVLSVREAVFNQNIVIGAGVQTNGTYFRYSQCEIEYVRIEYLNDEDAPDHIEPWQMLIHNDFDTYIEYITGNGNDFEIMDNGDWVRVISNGFNENNTSFYNIPRFVYANIKNKKCRLTWNIECSNPAAFSTDNGGGNLSLGLFSVQNQSSGHTGQNRVAKVDYATLAQGNFLGYHQEIFIPSEVFTGLTESTYFGWNIGFRSAVEGLTINILQLDFEVLKW